MPTPNDRVQLMIQRNARIHRLTDHMDQRIREAFRTESANTLASAAELLDDLEWLNSTQKDAPHYTQQAADYIDRIEREFYAQLGMFAVINSITARKGK